jgi:hypothetical protein
VSPPFTFTLLFLLLLIGEVEALELKVDGTLSEADCNQGIPHSSTASSKRLIRSNSINSPKVVPTTNLDPLGWNDILMLLPCGTNPLAVLD